MTQDSLIRIEPNSEASSSVLNGNFTYLDTKIGLETDAIKGGSNTTIATLNSQIATINSYIGSGSLTPPGTIIMYAGYVIPYGYLLCDGKLYDYTAQDQQFLYNLFQAIGNIYGGTAPTFRVPDLRNRFPKGSGLEEGYLPVGTYGNPILADHYHEYKKATAPINPDWTYVRSAGGIVDSITYDNAQTENLPIPGSELTMNAIPLTDAPGSQVTSVNTSRGTNEPWNLVLNFLIKW